MKTVRHKFIIYPSTTSKNACYDYNRNYLEHKGRAQNEDNQPYVHAREKGYNQVKKNLASQRSYVLLSSSYSTILTEKSRCH